MSRRGNSLQPIKIGLYDELTVTTKLTVNNNLIISPTSSVQIYTPPSSCYDIVNKHYVDFIVANTCITATPSNHLSNGSILEPEDGDIAIWAGNGKRIKTLGKTATITQNGTLTVSKLSIGDSNTYIGSNKSTLFNTTLAGETINISCNSNTISSKEHTIISGPLFIDDAIDDPRCAINKRYIDRFLTSGIYPKKSVRVATTENLQSVYKNISFTNNDRIEINTLGSDLIIDSISLSPGDRILIKDGTYDDQTSQYNGVYDVNADTTNTDNSSWILTRSNDAWYDSLILKSGYYVEYGTVNAKTIWVCTNVYLTIGKDPIHYTQYASITNVPIVNIGNGIGIFSKNIRCENQFKSISGSEKIAVTGDTDEVRIDVNEKQLNISNMTGVLGVSQGGTGIDTLVPKGHLIVGSGLNRLESFKPPCGDIVGTLEPQTISNKVLDSTNDVIATFLTQGKDKLPIEIVPIDMKSIKNGNLVEKHQRVLTLTHEDIDINENMTDNRTGKMGTDCKLRAEWKYVQLPYLRSIDITISCTEWSEINTNIRGAGQIIISADSNDTAPQLIANIAKSDSTKDDFLMVSVCEIGKLLVRWKSDKGIEVMGTGSSSKLNYKVTVIGL